MEKSYGSSTVRKFFSKKKELDPDCVFSSLWLQTYGRSYLQESYLNGKSCEKEKNEVILGENTGNSEGRKIRRESCSFISPISPSHAYFLSSSDSFFLANRFHKKK